MTTWESIDNVERTDNLIVTSDAAFERVSSNEHFEEESERGFLKQNTSWLVQEIPNISFLDIADTMLESQKTLYNRKNWNIVVGKAGRSIEAQPQDLARLVSSQSQYTSSSEEFTIPFNDIEIPSGEDELNIKTFEFKNNWIEVLIPWVYRISYWWMIDPWVDCIYLNVWLYRNGAYVTSDLYERVDWFWSALSWWRSISLNCEVWDVLTLHVIAQWDNPTVHLTYNDSRFTYLEVQYIQQIL